MAFNGSGTFNLITGNPVVTGTTISSTWANNTLSDVASGLTNCVTRDGQSPATANLPMGNYKLTGVGVPTANGDVLVFGQNASIATLKLLGSSSGFVGLKGAAAAGSTTFTLPSADGSAGQALLTDGAGNLAFSSVTPFASGTAMLFAQTAAPTGWTKSTTHNDKALRVVSGAASSGGSVAFTTAFASQTPSGTVSNTFSVAATTLSTAQMPSHTHSSIYALNVGTTNQTRGSTSETNQTNLTSATGGGGSHTHTLSGDATFAGNAINLAVQYVDVIIATKD